MPFTTICLHCSTEANPNEQCPACGHYPAELPCSCPACSSDGAKPAYSEWQLLPPTRLPDQRTMAESQRV